MSVVDPLSLFRSLCGDVLRAQGAVIAASGPTRIGVVPYGSLGRQLHDRLGERDEVAYFDNSARETPPVADAFHLDLDCMVLATCAFHNELRAQLTQLGFDTRCIISWAELVLHGMDLVTERAVDDLGPYLAAEDADRVGLRHALQGFHRWRTILVGLLDTQQTEVDEPFIESQLQRLVDDPAAKRRDTVFMVVPEASRSGSPLIALNMLRVLSNQLERPCVIFLLDGGVMREEFESLGNVHLSSQFGATAYLPDCLHASPERSCAIAVSVLSSPLLEMFARIGLPSICCIHEFPDPDLLHLFVEAYTHAHELVFPATLVQARAQEVLGRLGRDDAERPTHCAAQPTSPDKVFTGDRDQARRELLVDLALHSETFVVLGVGVMTQRKGLDLFVQAARGLRESLGADVPIAFVWVGAPTDESSREFHMWVERDVEVLGLKQQVRFLHATSEVAQYYGAADCFLMLSRADPYPCVVQEAIGSGLPVVCFDETMGCAELVDEHGGTAVPYLAMDRVVAELAAIARIPQWVRRQTIEDLRRRASAIDYTYGDYVETLLTLVSKARSSMDGAAAARDSPESRGE